MKTRILKIEKNNIENLKEASHLIRKGELVAFPTETVYGLGADGLNKKAVEKIFIAKGRPQDNPLILHISHLDMLKPLVMDIPKEAKLLMEKFWPGPLTIIFKKSSFVPDIISGGLETVAIRMPKNEIALELIHLSNTPIAAPSANISGRPSPTDAKTCYEDLCGKIELIIDGGDTIVGLESTVIDMTGDVPTILRPGAITLEMISKLLPNAEVDKSIITEGEIPKSPGQKYKHYAPKADAFLLIGNKDEKLKKLDKFISENEGKKIGIMATTELLEKINYENIAVKNLGSISNLENFGSLIFRDLRDLDKLNVDVIICEGVEETGLGMAIMNRLKKSTSNRYI
ncbi:MAG: threonylcarbamoyl-AMP synthase [Tissierellia bacterium]|nr:threonylcarbamoyl-AMP synthase [Tissierellia bacterium]